MIRLFLVFVLVFIPSVSKAEYKWFGFAEDLYLDTTNSIVNGTEIQFYLLFNNTNTGQSSISAMGLDCSELSLTTKSTINYSEPNGKGVNFLEFVYTKEEMESRRQFIQPSYPFYDIYNGICTLGINRGREGLQELGLRLYETQPLE